MLDLFVSCVVSLYISSNSCERMGVTVVGGNYMHPRDQTIREEAGINEYTVIIALRGQLTRYIKVRLPGAGRQDHKLDLSRTLQRSGYRKGAGKTSF